MITLESIANGTEMPKSGKLRDLLYSQDGELPLANIAAYLIESRYNVIAAFRATRQEQMEDVCEDYDHICGLLESYLQFVDENFKGYPKAEWPADQVEFLLASASPLAEMLNMVSEGSLSQNIIDMLVDSEGKFAALEQMAKDSAKPLRVSVKTESKQWVKTPEPYYWMETCGLVSIAYVTGMFYIHISPRGEATYKAAKAQKEAKTAGK